MIDWFVMDLTKFVCKILFNNENKILIKERKLIYLTKKKFKDNDIFKKKQKISKIKFYNWNFSNKTIKKDFDIFIHFTFVFYFNSIK